MDDIIITGNKSSFVSSVIKLLGVDFDLKDLGLLHYFLGLQIDYTSSGLFVHQTKYASDLLRKFGMIDCKPCKTPSSPNSHLLPNDSPLLSDPTSYRSLVGALRYLTFTRPDLSFVVQQACKHMSTPTKIILNVFLDTFKAQCTLELHSLLVLFPYMLTVALIGLETMWIGDPSLVWCCSLAILLSPGLPRNKALCL